MTLAREQGESFAAVGFLCSLMVVAIHCSGLAKVWLAGADGGISPWAAALQFVGIASAGLFLLAAGGVVAVLLLRAPMAFAGCQRLMILFGLAALWLNRTAVRALLLPFRRWWGLAFFVYAAHILFTSLAYRVAVGALPPSVYETVGYVLKIAVGIGGSLALGAALHRFAPRLLDILCGGRSP